MQRERDALECSVVDVQVLDERTPVELAAVLREKADDALDERVEPALGDMELALEEHVLGDVPHEADRPVITQLEL